MGLQQRNVPNPGDGSDDEQSDPGSPALLVKCVRSVTLGSHEITLQSIMQPLALWQFTA